MAPSTRLLRAARRVPGVDLVVGYRRADLGPDLVAGLVLTAVLVPQGMAYAELAGLPAVTGLYTTVVTLLAYALVGPSPTLILGPDSSLAPLILATIAPLVAADGDPDQAVAMAGVLALMMGAVAVLAGLTGLGAIAELLSLPIRVGYLNGLALVIIVGQIPKLLGFGTDTDGFLDDLRGLVEGIADERVVPEAAVIGVGALAVILVTRHRAPAVPGVLVAVGGALAVVALGGLDEVVPVVGSVPAGLPSPTVPTVASDTLDELALGAVAIAFVTLTDTIALARSVAGRHGRTVDADHEIAALGAANLAAGLVQGFPVSASTSRTAVAEATGARTQLTGVVGAVAILGVLVFATGLLADLPSSALAAVVVASGLTLLDTTTMAWLWRVRRWEFSLAAITTLGVLAVGVLEAIAVAVVLSLAEFVRRAWRPHHAVLGRIEGSKGYHDLTRHTEDGRAIPGLVIYRFDAPLFFANADHFRASVLAELGAAPTPPVWLALSAEPITDIDATGVEMLGHLLDELDRRDVRLVVAELKGPVKDRLRTYGLVDRIGEAHLYPTLGTMVDAYLDVTGTDWTDWTDR